MSKTLERLTRQLEEAEEKIEKLEQEKEDREYDERWKWRHIRELSLDENMDLPVPRLEIRYREFDKYNCVADYGLVYRHLCQQIEFIPMGSSKIGGHGNYIDRLELPFRDGAHIYNEMKQLGLRGFVVGNGKYREIDLSKPR